MIVSLFSDIFIYLYSKSNNMGKTEKNNEKKHFIAKEPMKRFMRKQGAEIIGSGALELIIDEIEKIGRQITRMAMDASKDEDRKKIMPEDVRFAFFELGYGDRVKESIEQEKNNNEEKD